MLTVVNGCCVRSWGKIITVVGREDFSSRGKIKAVLCKNCACKFTKLYVINLKFIIMCLVKENANVLDFDAEG